MLGMDELKVRIHSKKLPARDKLLLVLGSFDGPRQIKDLTARAREAGFKVPNSWNPSSILARTDGLAIRTPVGWEITAAGRQHLRKLGITKGNPAAIQVALDLRSELLGIRDEDTRAFVEEAIKCDELECYRSAVVMSWLAAVHVLQRNVIRDHIAAFNAEARKRDPKWKDARTTDDLGRMKESDFLEILAHLSVIGKNVKDQLRKCLDLRNGAGHPNSLKIGANAVGGHLEILVLNVFRRFQ